MLEDENHNEVNEPLRDYQQPLTFEKVWQMFQETDKMFKETDKKFLETDRQFKETDRKIQETARLIKELREEYKSRWGELVESLVSGNLLRLLQQRNIPVNKIRRRVRQYKGEPNYELDIVASNGDEVVIVEVKSKLDPWGVKHFISQLQLIRNQSRRFRNQRIIGAVAFMTEHCDASSMAINQGLIVIRANGDSAVILNEEGFEPKRF